MKIEVSTKKPEASAVQVTSLGSGLAFRLVQGDDQPVYLLDYSDAVTYNCINMSTMTVASVRPGTMVYPVKVKAIKIELELE